MFGSLNDGLEIGLGLPRDDYMIEILTNGLYPDGFWEESETVDHFVNNGHTYYSLHHGSEYKVKMTNNTNKKVNAMLRIDGVRMGKWRIDPYSDIIIERPANNQRKFTFVEENSWEASSGNVLRGNNENGLVEVTFIPELNTSTYFNDSIPMRRQFGQMTNSFSNSFSNKSINESYSAGATVLGDDSSQSFGSASQIYEDHAKKVTRRVRLVVSNKRKPFVSIRSKSECYDDPIPPKLPRLPMSPRSSRPSRLSQFEPFSWWN